MGIILIIMGIITAITYFIFYIYSNSAYNKDYRFQGAKNTVLVLSLIAFMILGCVKMTSYESYIKLKGYQAAIEQNQKSLNIYTDKVNLPGTQKLAFTDMKYNQYQNSLKDLIIEYKAIVVEYNTLLIAKRLFAENWLFNVIVVGPDKDMKIINMK